MRCNLWSYFIAVFSTVLSTDFSAHSNPKSSTFIIADGGSNLRSVSLANPWSHHDADLSSYPSTNFDPHSRPEPSTNTNADTCQPM